MFFNRVKKKFW